ncbi:MAG: response regulator [Alphaproteobacteria bacterium]
MDLICGSAEHYFLTKLEELRKDSGQWLGLYFSFSRLVLNSDLVGDLSSLSDKIKAGGKTSRDFAEALHKELAGQFDGGVCVFADHDVFALIRVRSKAEKKVLDGVFKSMASKLPEGLSDMDSLNSQYKSYQKLADEKLLSLKRFEAYEALGDKHKVSSIAARRKRRDEPLVMVVEDDRFTAHYASTILNSEFDLIVCKDGEEAVQAYVENAPDIVFLDIHLPGMTGHEVLEAIYAADRDAFVVMLSVDSVRDNIVKATQMGARKFIKKPFTKERLVKTVKESPYVRALLASDRAGTERMFH